MALQWLSLWRQRDRSYFLRFIHTVSLSTICFWLKEEKKIKNRRPGRELQCGNATDGCRTFQGHDIHIWISACETATRYTQAVYADCPSVQTQNSVAQLSTWRHRQWSETLPLVPAFSLTSPGPVFCLEHQIHSLNQGEDSTWESFLNSYTKCFQACGHLHLERYFSFWILTFFLQLGDDFWNG